MFKEDTPWDNIPKNINEYLPITTKKIIRFAGGTSEKIKKIAKILFFRMNEKNCKDIPKTPKRY